ncbi:MAG TPA: CocE/NonD family hydrolase [Chloroflexota bacterium]|nr:CocE/NonD family hydrolase [Chloroflexota bacterium]
MPRGAPGLAYALARLRGAARPPVTITDPPASIRFERDVPVAVRDGTVLRVNVFRPAAAGAYPVLMCAHPYGKDHLPRRTPLGYLPPIMLRLMRQDRPFRFSAWTSWEAPDPAYWVPRGYVVVNCDLRGFGHSDGVGTLLSDAEADDYYDLIEWAAAQPWSSGRVGLNGVSYLALSQWKVAALRPPHLAAICPWEGFSDVYRDLAYPGGIREDGFLPFWSAGVRREGRCTEDVRQEQLARPWWDPWWAARTAPLEQIAVPALICGSFSDHNLHSRGAFEAFGRLGSPQRWLYTHRGGKWATYYSAEALAFQARFFDHFLKDEDTGLRALPSVRLEVRERGDRVHAVRHEAAWPLPRTVWTPLYLHLDGTLRAAPAATTGVVRFDTARQRVSFAWTAPEDVELTGPMALRLHVAVEGANDACLFVGVRKLRGGRHVVFEGSYGFGYDLVTRGWLRLSHRRLDPARSEPWRPWLTHETPEPLAPGAIVPADVELLPSATLFRRGETLRLDVQGRYFFRKHPLFGQFPAAYEHGPRATVALHCGGAYDARLLVPVIPTA